MDAKNPDYITRRVQDDELSLGDLARAVWRARSWAVVGGLGGAFVAGASVLAAYLVTPEISSFRQDIALVLDDGRYPNGTDFSTNDLRSPIVLQNVHDVLELETFGLTLREFSAAIAVTPASETYDGVISRYRERLADSSLTYSERQQIEAEFSTALSGALGAGARVEFVLPPSHSVPADIGRAVVTTIPNLWADIYINQLGVLNLPIPGASAELVNADFLDTLDYPMAYDALSSGLTVLSERLTAAMAVPGAQNLRAGVEGRTLFDIERDVDLIDRYSIEHVLAPLTELGLNKSPDVTAAAYRYQTEDLSRRIELAQENARVIDAALNARGAAFSPPTTAAASASLGDPSGQLPSLSSQGSVVQQFGPELVDRLVLMSVENASVDFRETLINSKLQYEHNALALSADRNRLEQRLAMISGDVEIENRDVLASIFSEESGRVVTQLNAAWADVESILARANLERLSHDKELFSFLPTSDSATSNRTLLDRRSAIMIIAALLGGMVLGLLAHMTAGAVRTRNA